VAKVAIPYVKAYQDRHGKPRYYFRRRGFKAAPLPGKPGSPEFAEAYHQAMSGETAPARQLGAERVVPGSMSALIVAFYQSADFKDLAPSTHKAYRHILERFRAKHGAKPAAKLETRHVRDILDKVEGPSAREKLRKLLRLVMAHAVEREWRPDNPVLQVGKPKRTRAARKNEGFIPWSDADIEAFEAKYPAGSRERLALALLLYTGQRRSDVAPMGRQLVQGDKIRVRQVKGDERLAIPIHPALQTELDNVPADQMTFVLTREGKPFTPAGFTNWFSEAARAAGLVKRTPHGLRKAAARRLAEAGCSVHEIAAITGHTTLKEVERYTRDAARERLAEAAMDKLGKVRHTAEKSIGKQ
jgi:integrase